MAVTKQDLIDGANQIISESEKGGNTASRVGNLFLAFISFIAAVEGKIVDIPEYDDSELRKAIDNLKDAASRLDQIVSDTQDLATSERDRLQALLDTLDQTINGKISDMYNSAAWAEQFAKQFQQEVSEGKVAFQSGWNADIEAYLQRVGVWARDGETGVTKTQWTEFQQSVNEISSTVNEVTADLQGRPTKVQWSEISQKVDSIESSVNSLTQKGNVSEALQSAIKQYVKDGVAGMNLESTYALKDTEGSKEVLEWMYSAFKNQSAQDMSFAQMTAAGKDTFSSGISEIKASSELVQNGEVLSRVQKTTIENLVGDSLAAFYSQSSENEAGNSIFSQIKKTIGDVTSYNTAGVVTESNLEQATAALFASAKQDMETVAGSMIAEATTGLASESYVNTQITDAETGLKQTITKAESSLTAKIEEVDEKGNKNTDAIAGVVTSVEKVSNDLSTEVTARVNAIAEVKDAQAGMLTEASLEGAMTQLIAQKGDIAAAIVAKVNEKDSEISLSADKITMTNAFVNSITANTVFTNYLKGGTAEFKGTVYATNGEFTGKVTATSGSFTGAINATSLTLGSGVSIAQSKISGLASALSTIQSDIKSNTNALANKADSSDLPTKLSDLTNDLDLDIPTKLSDLTNDMKFSTVSVSETQLGDGTTRIATTVNGTTYYTYRPTSGEFLITNVGKGKDASGSDYFMVDTNGLLTARNALIYGTVYATNGSFAGEITASSGSIGGFEIGDLLLHTDDKLCGMGNDPYFYSFDSADPYMWWANYKTPTETWSNSFSNYSTGYSEKYLWVRAAVNTTSYTASDASYIYTEPVPLVSPYNQFGSIECWYAVQDSSLTTPPTSGWTAFSSYNSSIIIPYATKQAMSAGKHYWIRINVAITDDYKYIRLTEDAASVFGFRLQYTESSVGAPTFSVTKEGTFTATAGSIGGFLIGSGYIGSTSDGTNLYLSSKYVKIGSSTVSALLGNSLYLDSSSDLPTALQLSNIVNNKTTRSGVARSATNYGLYINVANATTNYGVYSNAAVKAPAVIGDTIKEVDVSSGYFKDMNFAQYNVFMLKRNSSTVYTLTMPTYSEVCSMFGYSSLSSNFGVRFTMVIPINTSLANIKISGLYDRDGATHTYTFNSGDVVELLCTYYGSSFRYIVLSRNSDA